MIIVTGGAGFIGSNIVRALNQAGVEDIIVVDDLEDGIKYRNILDCEISDYLDKTDFLQKISKGFDFGNVEAIFHQGACSSTTEWNGQFMMENNYEFSKSVYHYCNNNEISFIYASSAATYGGSDTFSEKREYEKPLNVYGYSKFLFDQWIRKRIDQSKCQVVGFRYFNVYGYGEHHKGTMSSVAFHFNEQIKSNGVCKLFDGFDGYEAGKQLRDFVYIEDVVKVNLWFWKNPDKSGIFNLGTGKAESFLSVANAVVAWHGKGSVEYIPFPDHLKGAYQSYTQADISLLREVGYSADFHNVASGVKSYLDILNEDVS